MKAVAVATALIAALAVAAPAEAANKKKKKTTAVQAPSAYQNLQRVPPHKQHPHGVYTSDGELIGMDPDPNIRMMLRKDMKPWDNNS